MTPCQRHREEDKAILSSHHNLYVAAKEKNPSRWSESVKNWDRIESGDLNPDKPEATAEKAA